jgi:hypothetical protein
MRMVAAEAGMCQLLLVVACVVRICHSRVLPGTFQLALPASPSQSSEETMGC